MKIITDGSQKKGKTQKKKKKKEAKGENKMLPVKIIFRLKETAAIELRVERKKEQHFLNNQSIN